jgi:hypothetical protein
LELYQLALAVFGCAGGKPKGRVQMQRSAAGRRRRLGDSGKDGSNDEHDAPSEAEQS